MPLNSYLHTFLLLTANGKRINALFVVVIGNLKILLSIPVIVPLVIAFVLERNVRFYNPFDYPMSA